MMSTSRSLNASYIVSYMRGTLYFSLAFSNANKIAYADQLYLMNVRSDSFRYMPLYRAYTYHRYVDHEILPPHVIKSNAALKAVLGFIGRPRPMTFITRRACSFTISSALPSRVSIMLR